MVNHGARVASDRLIHGLGPFVVRRLYPPALVDRLFDATRRAQSFRRDGSERRAHQDRGALRRRFAIRCLGICRARLTFRVSRNGNLVAIQDDPLRNGEGSRLGKEGH